ncbi:MAG TPA: MFS transporter, partial [Vulgatibacter sp.]
YAAVAPGFLADLFEEKRRGRILALFYAALPVGSALGFTLGGVVGTAYGWRSAFLVAGAPGALLGLFALLLREPVRGASDPGFRLSSDESAAARSAGEERGNGDGGPAGASIGVIVRTLARSPGFRLNTLGYTAATFAMGGLAAWWPTFLARERGVPLDRGGFLFGAVLVVAGFLGTLAGGWLGDRLHARDRGGHFLAAGWGLLAAFPFAVAGVLLPDPAWYWPAIFVALFFLFFNTAPLNAVLVNVAPPSMRASAVAINVLVIHLLGDAISPWLMGLVSDSSSLGRAVLLDCGMIAVAGLVLVAGAGALRRELAPR